MLALPTLLAAGGILMNLRCCALLLVPFLVAGCFLKPKQPQSAEQLKGRLDAASTMTNVAQRDDALSTIALDAADAGEGDIVKKALEGMSNVSKKNDTAYDAALKLSERGKTPAAVEVAKMISNTAKQNEALSKIAKG